MDHNEDVIAEKDIRIKALKAQIEALQHEIRDDNDRIEALTRRVDELQHAHTAPDFLTELADGSTGGTWGQFSPSYGPWKEQAEALWKTDRKRAIQTMDTSHHVSTVREDGTPYRIAEFHHAADAAFVEALVNAYATGRLIVLKDGNTMMDNIGEALIDNLGDCYVCDRVWEAWSVGTMSEEDFWHLPEQQGIINELSAAVYEALRSATLHNDTPSGDKFDTVNLAAMAMAYDNPSKPLVGARIPTTVTMTTPGAMHDDAIDALAHAPQPGTEFFPEHGVFLPKEDVDINVTAAALDWNNTADLIMRTEYHGPNWEDMRKNILEGNAATRADDEMYPEYIAGFKAEYVDAVPPGKVLMFDEHGNGWWVDESFKTPFVDDWVGSFVEALDAGEDLPFEFTDEDIAQMARVERLANAAQRESDEERQQGIDDAVQMVDNLAKHGIIDPVEGEE